VRRPFGVKEFDAALTEQAITRFKEIYREVLNREPFTDRDAAQKDLDVVPLVNFAIFSTVQSREAAEEGLKAAFRSRLPQLSYVWRR
jgi:hypothetical protein